MITGVQHAPLAPAEDAYPGGDVQDIDNNRITHGQSQGSSEHDDNAATATVAQASAPQQWTGPGASITEQRRDNDERLVVHKLIPNAERLPPVPRKAIIVCKPPPKGKDLYCHACWFAKRVVYWQDRRGLDKHNRDHHNGERGDSSVPHFCIFECGYSKRSTLANHFLEHRKRGCKPYSDLLAQGGLQEFLTRRKLHGHWQLNAKGNA